jgi:tetratricopeptide (TPR) repeat protein
MCRTSGTYAGSLKWIRVVLIVFSFFASTTVSRVLAAPVDEAAYTAGLQAVRAGDNGKAITLFSRAIELNPNDFRYYNDRGIAHKASGNLEKALEDYTKALTIKPDYPNALNNRGLLFVQQRQFDRAVEDFRQALKVGGFEAKIHTNLGMALAGKGNHEAAVEEFQAAMNFRPMDPRAFLFMAQSLEQLGKGDQAMKMYQVALGMVKDPAAEDHIEKRITALEKNAPETQRSAQAQVQPEVQAKPMVAAHQRVATPAPRVTQAPPLSPITQVAQASRVQREVLRARPVAMPPVSANEGRVTACEPLPSSLEGLDRGSRTRALEKFSPSAGEIFRQGMQFMDQADTKMAIVRFEDSLQLEKRNKNTLAVGWSMLQAGRAYLKIGDRIKASANIEAAFRIFQRMKSESEMVLALVDMAAIKKAAGQKEQASRLLSEAAREAAAMNNHELTSALRDMAAGRTPDTQKRSASAASAPPDEAKQGAAPVEPPTAVARLDLVKRGDATAGAVPENKATSQPAVAKEKKPETPASAVPHPKPDPAPAAKVRGPVTWGRSQTEAKVVPAPQPQPKQVPEPTGKSRPGRASIGPDRIQSVPQRVAPSRPVTVETGVGGKPSAVAPSPVQDIRKKKPSLEKENAARPVEVRQQQAAAQPDPIVSQLTDSARRLTREERREAAANRISADLAELKRFNASGDETSMIVVLERLARRYALRRQYDRALHGLTASLALREKLGLDGPATQLFDDRGTIKQKVGDQAGALEDLTRALVLAEGRGQASGTTALEERCRVLAREMGLDPGAALHAYRSLWKARTTADGRGETDALHALGTLYDNAQKPSVALNYYERSAASVLTDKARMYGKLGKQKLAGQSYKEALEAFKRLDYSRYLVVLRESGLDSTPSALPRR